MTLTRPSAWCCEPYRVFFPLGLVLAWAGVLHWLLHGLGLLSDYRPVFHSITQIQGFLICFALGSFQFGLGFLLLTLGTRYLPAAEVALFALSESILNPIWVWIGVNEVPGSYTLYGSAIVLASVVTYSLIAIRAGKQPT